MSNKILSKHCRVCGDVAQCFNFNGLSCESCKAFFRRNAVKTKPLMCYKGGNCTLYMTNRKFCKRCRLDKCYAIGMKKELITSYHEVAAPDSLKIPIESINKSSNSLKSSNYRNNLATVGKYKSNDFGLSFELDELFFRLNATKQDEKFVECFKRLGLPQTVTDPQFLQQHEIDQIKHIKKAMSIFVNENELPLRENNSSLSEQFNMIGFYVEKTIKFCNNFEFFRNLNEHEKLVVFKPFFIELYSFKISFIYDTVKDGFRIVENNLHDRVIFAKTEHCDRFSAGAASRIRRFHSFCKSEMENDSTIRDLIITQFLFRPKEELKYPETQCYLSKFYCRILKRYLDCKYKNLDRAERKYFTLMGIMNDLESVRKQIHNIYNQIEPANLSHTIAEILDIQ